MKLSALTSFTLAAIAVGSLFTSSAIAQNATAANVRMVTYAGGSFFQSGPASWRQDENGRTTYFGELARTSRAVWLFNATTTRSRLVKLDMYQHKVLEQNAADGLEYTRFDMESDSTKINGRIVTSVRCLNSRGAVAGGFRQIDTDQWIEFDTNHALSRVLRETNRDDWSVYLLEPSSGLALQLDLHTRKVMASAPDLPRTAVYEIGATQ
jgi:hypothetical protein